MENITNAEEFLAGMGVDWKNYTPPGGEGWVAIFKHDIEPIFAKAKRDANADLEKYRMREARMSELQRHLQTVAKSLVAIAEISTAAGLRTPAKCPIPQDVDEANGLVAAIEEQRRFLLNDKPTTLRDIAEIESDIKFMNDLEKYINADRELDMLLYALYTVEVKFRNKILREALRLLKVVEGVRPELAGSSSKIKNLISHVTAPMFKTLNEAYAKCAPELRKLKKLVDKQGAAAWKGLPAAMASIGGLI